MTDTLSSARARLQRRRVMRTALGLGIGTAGLWAVRPGDHGAAHDAYFARIAQALKRAGIAAPTLVIDRERLHANAALLHRHQQQSKMALRLVNKSLPCLPLLDEAARLTGTRRQMVFNLPYLQALAAQRPDADVLLGKPLPVAAAARFHATPPGGGFDPARQLQWLVDTPERLAQYRDLARGIGRPLRINIEIDVGLHRGGVADTGALQAMVALLRSEPLLRWAGLMGYDAHTQKILDLPGLRERAHHDALLAYRRFADHMRASMPPWPADAASAPVFNTGGSLTYPLHDGRGAANEIAVGSALVKPSDFDTPLLSAMQAACFIATPVLKAGPFTMPDGVEPVGRLISAWDVNRRQGLFIHGGNWLAHPLSPAGLSPSLLMGASSNQQILLASGTQGLRPDDIVFLRPTQSESVLQQFGDIAVYEEGRITAMWPVLPAHA